MEVIKQQGTPLTEYENNDIFEYTSKDEYIYKEDLTMEENQLLKDIHHANFFTQVIDEGISKDIFIKKSYMIEKNIYNSHILRVLLKNSQKLHVRLKLDLNKILTAISYLCITSKSKFGTLSRLPDKKLSYILDTNMQKTHELMFYLQLIFKDTIEDEDGNKYTIDHLLIETDTINRYYTYSLDKEYFMRDSLISNMIKYLTPRYIGTANNTSKRNQKRLERFYKKNEFLPLNKLDKSKNLYYEKSMFNKDTSRTCFKKIFLGLTWYATELFEKYYTPDKLKEIRDINGIRDDIYYTEVPIVMLCDILNRNGKAVMTRIHTTIQGMRGLIKKHDCSYNNISEPNQEINFKRTDEYQNLELNKYGKLKKNDNNQIIHNDQYKARIQGFNTTSFSYIIFSEYFNTSIGKYILENRDLYYYIIKRYLVENKGLDDSKYAEKLKELGICGDWFRTTLTEEQIQELLDGPLADIDLDNEYLREAANKLLDKEKIRSLPKIKARTKREYHYNDCMEKDKDNGKFIVNKNTDPYLGTTEKEVIKKDPKDCVFILMKIYRRITTANKSKKISIYNLKYYLRQFELVKNHVASGFISKTKSELKEFILTILKYHMSKILCDCEEALPYRRFLL